MKTYYSFTWTMENCCDEDGVPMGFFSSHNNSEDAENDGDFRVTRKNCEIQDIDFSHYLNKAIRENGIQ